MKENKEAYKITKSWFVEAKSYLEANKKSKKLPKDPDEIKITKVRDW